MRAVHAFTQQVLVIAVALLLAGCTASVDDAAPATTGSRAAGSDLTFTVPPGTTLPIPTGPATPLPLLSGSHLDGGVKLPWSSVGRPMDGKVVVLTVDVGCASVVYDLDRVTPEHLVESPPRGVFGVVVRASMSSTWSAMPASRVEWVT